MSNQKCAVPGCLNATRRSKDILHVFPNPARDKNRFNSWVYAVGGGVLGLSNEHIAKYRRICHRHFEEKYVYSNKYLSKNAIPTKHLPDNVVKFVSDNESLRPIRNVATPGEAGESTSKARNPNCAKSNSHGRFLPDCKAGLFKLEYIKSAVLQEHRGDVKENIGDSCHTKNVSAHLQVFQEQRGDPIIFDDFKENIGDSCCTTNVSAQLQELKRQDSHPQLVAPEIVAPAKDLDDCFKTRNVASQPKETVTVTRDPASKITHKRRMNKIREAARCNSAAKLQKKLRKRVAVTKHERLLYGRLLKVGIKLSKSRNKIKCQTAKLKKLQNITTHPRLLQTLNNLPSTAKVLTLLQFRENKKKDKGRRFTLQEKIIALSICKRSPKGYKFLRKIFLLPSPQTLVKLINLADIKPGINRSTFNQLAKTAEKMKKEERLCVLLFDEMSLTANVSYNERKDRVGGFVTNGVKTLAEFADHAQVFLIRGVLHNYKQPVSYTFSQAATKGPELAVQLKTLIGELQAAGLTVVATICDQGSNNMQCIKILTQEARANQLRKGICPKDNIILINDQEIVPLYDPPHLMKCIRNNLLTKNLVYVQDGKTKTAKWSHITGLHSENPGYKGIRLVPKLTDLHCVPSKIPKMKVKYATQVFSQTVASNMGYLTDKGILPLESKETADVLLFFDRLFDSTNGSFAKKTRHAKPLLGAATPTSPHHKTWIEARKMLSQMVFVNPISKKKETVPTLKNWIWTLNGLEVLLLNLKKNFDVSSVWLRHLNQDPIENFFGSIRSHGCRNNSPTPDMFQSAYTTLLINSISGVHATGANCEMDKCVSLQETLLSDVLISDNGNDNAQLNFPDMTITTTPLESKNDPRVIGGLQYVTGFFIKSAKKNVFRKCQQCITDLTSEEQDGYIKYREYANKKWLHYPSDALLKCASSLQDIYNDVLKKHLEINNLKRFIKSLILKHVEFKFIKCEEHRETLINFLINISTRFFIHNYCKEINGILTHRRQCEDEGDVFQMKAKNYARKTFKRKRPYPAE